MTKNNRLIPFFIITSLHCLEHNKMTRNLFDNAYNYDIKFEEWLRVKVPSDLIIHLYELLLR